MRLSEPAELDDAVATLAARKDEWAHLSTAGRIELLRRCKAGWVREAAAIVEAACRAKALDPRSSASAEEWVGGPLPVIRNIRLLIDSLCEIERAGRPRLRADAVRRRADGGIAVEVFPRDRFDPVMYPGVRIDVWMQPDVTESNLVDTMALAYRDAGRDARATGLARASGGKTALVLGAGNIASIGPMDVLYKLFVENQVVVLKMHPVNEYLGPLIERACQPLVDRGYLRMVYGDAPVGHYLVHHAGVDEIHMTGSAAVHDRIVWGETADERARRRAANAPKVAKRITSELGCVTPIVVVPGEWSEDEIAYQAENVATMVAHNASCNCNAAKLIVTWRGWTGRRPFLDRVARVLASLPARVAYYPGSAARYRRFLEAHPESQVWGIPAGDTLPFATMYDIDPAKADDVAFREEAWCPIVAETALDADDVGHFMEVAPRFCNDQVEGTLSCGVLVDTRARARLGALVDAAVAALRYGTVAVNHWPAMCYALATPPWGAYPGHTLADVGSGIGTVHNTLMFDRPLKTVLWGPFTSWPKPVWFSTHRRGHVAARRMVAFEASPSLRRLPGIALPAMRP